MVSKVVVFHTSLVLVNPPLPTTFLFLLTHIPSKKKKIFFFFGASWGKNSPAPQKFLGGIILKPFKKSFNLISKCLTVRHRNGLLSD